MADHFIPTELLKAVRFMDSIEKCENFRFLLDRHIRGYLTLEGSIRDLMLIPTRRSGQPCTPKSNHSRCERPDLEVQQSLHSEVKINDEDLESNDVYQETSERGKKVIKAPFMPAEFWDNPVEFLRFKV